MISFVVYSLLLYVFGFATHAAYELRPLRRQRHRIPLARVISRAEAQRLELPAVWRR